MRTLFRKILLTLLVTPALLVQGAPVSPHPEITIAKGAGNTYTLTWKGLPGHTYFIQTTTTPNVAGSWVYCPMIEYGSGPDISWGCSAPASTVKWFLRLKYTDAVPPGGNHHYADYDGDGIPNIVEVTAPGTGIGTGSGTDPFTSNALLDADADGLADAVEVYFYGSTALHNAASDADGDGLTFSDEVRFYGTSPTVNNDPDADGYLTLDETTAGSDPNLVTSIPFDPANPPPPNRFVVPVSWWVENKFGDTIEALNARGEGARVAVFAAGATAIADGSYDLPFISVQAAVNAAAANDVIQVAPGLYEEAVDLTAKNVKLIGQRGSREETIIQPPPASAQGILLGAANTAGTVISGLTVQSSQGAAVKCTGGAAPVLHNLYLKGNVRGVEVVSASPVLSGVLCENSTGTAATDAALSVSGSGARVLAGHCTFADNVPANTTGGQVQVVGTGNRLAVQNSVVSSAADRVELKASAGAGIAVAYSSVRGGYAGLGNLATADAANPQFDARAVVGGQRRLLPASPCVDRASPAGLPGYSYLTRLDADGETRRRAFGVAVRVSRPDIGCDEFVSRLTFPTVNRSVRGQVKSLSRVDEASDVAFLGQLPNGNARIAVINDETINPVSGGNLNEVTFYEVDKTTGNVSLTRALSISRGSGAGMETRDPEGMAYDAAAGILYVTTSQTKVNHYRGCEPTGYDALVDPPSNDYDPRRCVVLSVPIGVATDATNPLLPSGVVTFYDARDGEWQATLASRRTMDAFLNAQNTFSPVGFQSPNGLVAAVKNQLAGNAALGAQVKSAGVLIAINTVPKFGNPVNGVTYQPGAALPYGQAAGLGGPAGTAGYALPLPANLNTADFPYYDLATLPAGGQQIVSYRTAVGGANLNLAANTTYYFKAWAYDAQRQYSRGLEAQTTITARTPVVVNELFSTGTGPDWVEFFNPAGVAVNLSGLGIADDSQDFRLIPTVSAATPLSIPARGTYRMFATGAISITTSSLHFDLGGSDGVWVKNGGVISVTNASLTSPTVTLASAVLPQDFAVGSTILSRLVTTISGQTVTLAGNSDRAITAATLVPYGGATDGFADEFKYPDEQISNVSTGRVWDGGARFRDFSFGVPASFKSKGSRFRTAGPALHPVSGGSSNHTQAQAPAKLLQATHNPLTQAGIFLHYTNLGQEPAVWSYSPKQQDFHPISVEGLAVRSQTEMVVGLRSPLVNRTTGNAYALVFSNAGSQFLPAAGWPQPALLTDGNPAQGLQSVKQIDLNGQGIRSIQWCPQLNSGAGAYLIIGGAANGGPLKNETTRQVFSLYRWDNINAVPVRVVADLAPFAVRPEGVNIITLNGTPRVLFVEDRFKAEGYDTQNAVHWPLAELNLQ
jgi:hypothetical protein